VDAKQARVVLFAGLASCGPTVLPNHGSADATNGDEGPSSNGTTSGHGSTSGDPESTHASLEPDPSAFIEPPDSGWWECTTWMQDCPPGEKCAWYDTYGQGAWNATKCVPISPNAVAPGEPCMVEGSGATGLDDCVAGAFCFLVDPETLVGTCFEYCIGTEAEATCTSPHEVCSVYGSGFNLCRGTCLPLLQDCPAGSACFPVGQQFVCSLVAAPVDGGNFGDPCPHPFACNAGLFCAGPDRVPGCDESFGCCMPFCSLHAPSCPDGTACEPWFPSGTAPPDYADLGACMVPP
jgi:hypothetical protein